MEETSGESVESLTKAGLAKAMARAVESAAAQPELPPGWPERPTLPHFYEATLTDPGGHGAALRFLSLPLTADRAARQALGEPMPHDGDELGIDLILDITPKLLLAGCSQLDRIGRRSPARTVKPSEKPAKYRRT